GTLALLVFLVSTNLFANPLSFQQWKSRRVTEKESVVEQIKQNKSLKTEARQKKLTQALANIETEKDLSPEDYFHLYLVELFKNNPNGAREAAKTLSKEELAAIIVSYINTTNQMKKLEALSPAPLQ